MPRKCQVSFEVLIVLAIGMLVGAPLLMYANREGRGSQESAAASGMDQLCGAIVERAEAMEGVGRESWSTITFRAGTPVLAVRPRSNELTLEVGGEGGTKEIVCYSKVPMRLANTGRNLTTEPVSGAVELKLQYKRGYVCLGAVDGDCTLTECEDGRDNDGNLCTDFPQDQGCTDYADNEEVGGQCEPPVCGNALVEAPEECDRGNLGGADCVSVGFEGGTLWCYQDCTFDTTLCFGCGDGAVTPPEECDDGRNGVATDACTDTCAFTFCGDGTVQNPNGRGTGGATGAGDEECDEGWLPTNGCVDCKRTFCGDGATQSPNGQNVDEECDDSRNGIDTDGCTDDCLETYCGDGIVQAPNGRDNFAEECDEGAVMPSLTCNADCTRTRCGDGGVQNPNAAGQAEECDAAVLPTNDCSAGCQFTRCGDGVVQAPNHDALNEECDAAVLPTNDCSAGCLWTFCGDSATQNPNHAGTGGTTGVGDEECDNGPANANAPDACRPDCTNPSCPDGIQDSGEGCDDGNLIDNDGCSNACHTANCGDGILQAGPPFNEQCDMGSGPGGNSDTIPDRCRTTCVNPSCGDAVTDTGEQCDDDNANNNDECLNSCLWSSCGDGYPQAPNHAGFNEQCDLGTGPGGNSDTAPNRCRLDCTNFRCGDDVVDPALNEECDGAAMPQTQCSALGEGWFGGTLTCVPSGQPSACNYDRSACDRCGNGVIDVGLGEVCDPPGSHTGSCSAALPSQTCSDDCLGCWADTCRPKSVVVPSTGNVDPLYYSPTQDDMDSVTMDSGGFILAAERGSGVRRFEPPTQAGTCNSPRLMTVPIPSLISGTSGTGARRMDVDNQGRIYLSLKDSGIVRVLRPDYTTLGSISMGSVRNVAVDYTRGFVYLSDLSTIRQYRENAGPSWSYTGRSWSGSNLDDLAFVPPDHLLISEEGSRFRIMNLNTYVIERSISGGIEGLTADRWGNALVVDANQNRLEVYSASTGVMLAWIQNACNDFNDMDDVHIDVDSGLLLTADQTNKKVVAMPTEDVLSVYLECVPPDCNDGIQNQDETMMDCGGICCDTLGICPPGC